MKLFLDTNIFAEFIGQRNQFEAVSQIVDAILDEEHSACISAGSIYTLAFIFERSLKAQDIHRPELTDRLRGYLSEVLNMATVCQLSHAGAEAAVYDKAFTDIEDSFLYRCALENHCPVLLTINTSDFKNTDQSEVEVLSPKEFIEKYM